MGASWRHMRTDRSIVNNKLDRGTIRRVLGFARPHRRLITGFLILTVIDACLVVVTPLLVQRIIDDGVLKDDVSVVVWLSLAMAATAIVAGLLTVAAGFLSSRIGEGLIYDLRTQVFAHVQRQSLAFFTRTQTGALVSRLNNDVIGAQRAFTSTLSSTVSNMISVLVVGVAMLALSWQVTVLCLSLFPLLFLTSRWVSGKLAGLTRQQMDGNADMGNVMTERFNVGGAMLLRLFGRRADEDALFATRAANVRDLGIRISLITRIFATVMMTVPALATAMVYGVGGYLAIQGQLSTGTLLALATLLLRLLGPLQGLSNVRIDVMTALVSFERVFEVLDLPSSIQEKPDAVVLPPTASRVEFEHVAFRYPRAEEVSLASLEAVARKESRDTGQVLQDISFVAEPGQMVALVGPSGAGKTTITHLVARLYDVGSGTVRVGGHDVRDVTLESLEDVVGYVTQDAHMFHDTIRANLLYARPGADDRDDLGRPRGGADRPADPVAARRPRHRGRRPRLPPLRRRAAAAGDRPAAAQGARRGGARRGDRPPRLRVRVGRPARARRGARGTHQPGHRAPALHDPAGRPDPRGRGRPGRPARHPRRPARRGRPVRRPLPHPVHRRPAGDRGHLGLAAQQRVDVRQALEPREGARVLDLRGRVEKARPRGAGEGAPDADPAHPEPGRVGDGGERGVDEQVHRGRGHGLDDGGRRGRCRSSRGA